MKGHLRLFLVLVLGCMPVAHSGEAAPDAAGATDTPPSSPRFARLQGSETFTVLISGTAVGQLEVTHDDVTRSEYEYRANGRGPTFHESIEFDAEGYPVDWSITGNVPFGNAIEEGFAVTDGQAVWTDTTGTGSAALGDARLYVAQQGGPFKVWLYARLLLADPDHRLRVLPAGELQLQAIETLSIGSGDAAESVTTYALTGIDLEPVYLALDASGQLFATMEPRFALIRAGYEDSEERMRALAVEYAARRFEDIGARVAHRYGKPVRINNVRVFDPGTLALSDMISVQIDGNRIVELGPVATQASANEVLIDGAGGTLVPGMYEMHGHLTQAQALLNVITGVTSVRDMGNDNAVLSDLIAKFDNSRLIGPRVTRSGFIEGASPFNSPLGILVTSEQEAVAAVKAYGSGEIGDFWQVKIYNSMNPSWIPAVVAEAHAQGLRVAGHVPAFTNADAMIAAGYDEMTHINQVVLGWVLAPDEDTRTLLRLTALRRIPPLPLSDPKVQQTLDAMAQRNVAMEPTIAIHEQLLLGRNGAAAPGALDYIEHMPISRQRALKTAMMEVATDEDDLAYRGAWDKIIEVLAEMRRRGIVLIPGTDQGGAFTFHRELELYQQVGMTPAEILKMATLDMATYVGADAELGSIEPGKLADFFLVPGDPTADLKAIKTIAMVVKDGTVLFPSEVLPEFGIQPFAPAPMVTTGL